jgi:hypothetical protein
MSAGVRRPRRSSAHVEVEDQEVRALSACLECKATNPMRNPNRLTAEELAAEVR